MLWNLERARAALAHGNVKAGVTAAQAAQDDATRLGFAELDVYAALLLGVLRATVDETWTELLRRAQASLCLDVALGALEMDARRLSARSDVKAANGRWRLLLARAQELGYQPGVEEAQGWLHDAE